jgi:hypothetical protein
MKLTTLEAYVNEHKQFYLDTYGKLDWHWYDEGLVYAIQDYVSMKCEFTEEDVEFLHRTEFEPEDFLKDIEEDEV